MDDEHLARVHYLARDHLPIWTVYRPTTKDYPGKWVARMHLSLPGPTATTTAVFGDTLEEVRAKLPPGLAMLARSPEDDPVIEEVWL